MIGTGTLEYKEVTMELPLLLFRGVGPAEIAIIVVVLVMVFGATRLPKIGASLGQSLRAFKNAISGQDEEEDDAGSKAVKSASKDQKD